jgi:hypothetical protein
MRKILLGTLLASCLLPLLAQAQATPAPAPAKPRQVQAAPAPAPAPVLAPPAPAAPSAAPLPAAPSAAPAVAPPTALPPPPPGYVYAPAPGAPPVRFDPVRRSEIYGELNQVDGRLRELGHERRKVSLAGPIALMAGGYGLALISSFVALASLATAETIEHRDWGDEEDADWNDDGAINRRDERGARNAARVFAGLAAVGVGTGIGGSVWFAKRMNERRLHSPEIRDLKERRRDLRRELRYGAMLSPERAELTVATSF